MVKYGLIVLGLYFIFGVEVYRYCNDWSISRVRFCRNIYCHFFYCLNYRHTISFPEKISNVQIAKFWVENNLEGIKSIYKKSVKYLMLIGGLLLIGILLNIEDMLSYLPQEYANSKNVTVIASIGAFINISTGLLIMLFYLIQINMFMALIFCYYS